jgi:release factor glutamine methyltransferase
MIDELIEHATRRLTPLSTSARLDAELLLGHALGIERSRLITREASPTAEQTATFRDLLERRAAGTPIAYLLGRRDFWTLTLEVTPAVLVPRPETELLVDIGLAALVGRPNPHIADLGTGSGAVGLALATERPDARVLLTDASPAALAVAERNRHRLGRDNVRCRAGDWYAAVDDLFDLIVSNPPYLGPTDPHLASPELTFEPHQALVAEAEGLAALGILAAGAPTHLKPGGVIALEHGSTQGEAVRALLTAAGLTDVVTHRDLAGLERATRGRRRD